MNYLSEVIAVIALLLAVYSTWRTSQFNKIQNLLGESQTKLNNLLVQEAEETKANSKKADLTAALVKGGRNDYKLHIWNQGNATARNVRFFYAEEDDVFIKEDVESKFPLDIEALGKDFPVKLIAAVTLGMDDRANYKITLIWDDDSGKNNEKPITATL